MKKLVATLAATCAVAASVVGVAVANPDAGTVVASGFACNVFDGNGNLFVTTDSELRLFANDQGSKAVLHCEGDGADAPFLQHYNFARTGATCGMLQFGSTTHWDNKVGRNGNSQLRCTQTLNGDDAAAAASSGAGIG